MVEQLQKNFQFECQKCGSCCSSKMEGKIYVGIEELLKFSKNLGVSIRELLDTCVELREETIELNGNRILFKVFIIKQNNGSCIFLKNKECSIYPFRPFQCKQYPFWNLIFNDSENFKGYALSCQGFNRGKRYDSQEIKQKLEEEFDYLRKLYKSSNFLKSLEINKLLEDINKKVENEDMKLEKSALEFLKKEILAKIIENYIANY